jgi:2-polyprenyl-3-methyl-5-hydroxy-6-metoxy-1,4-benzoquinol methylase
MACPLCTSDKHRKSSFSCVYQDVEFQYVECVHCESLYCNPMPEPDMVQQMYGPRYKAAFSEGTNGNVEDPKQLDKCIEWLRNLGTGTFLDYGCGAGVLLEAAAKAGWRSVGVELDSKVAREVEERTGFRVLTAEEADSSEGHIADILHLGDVLEHLTEMENQLPRILRLIKPGGLLLAQGPLEGNFNFFAACCGLSRRLRPWHRTKMAPYHVLMATSRGQRVLFERFGLSELEYSLHEVAWPAPSRLKLRDLARPRQATLFALRRVSVSLSALNGKKWGNRYFYAGRVVA